MIFPWGQFRLELQACRGSPRAVHWVGGLAAETVVVGVDEMGWMKEAPNLLLPFPSLPTLFFSSLHLSPAEHRGCEIGQGLGEGTSPFSRVPAARPALGERLAAVPWTGGVCGGSGPCQLPPAATPSPHPRRPRAPCSLVSREGYPKTAGRSHRGVHLV